MPKPEVVADEFLQKLWNAYFAGAWFKQPGGYQDCMFCWEHEEDEHDAECEFLAMQREAESRGLLRP